MIKKVHEAIVDFEWVKKASHSGATPLAIASQEGHGSMVALLKKRAKFMICRVLLTGISKEHSNDTQVISSHRYVLLSPFNE